MQPARAVYYSNFIMPPLFAYALAPRRATQRASRAYYFRSLVIIMFNRTTTLPYLLWLIFYGSYYFRSR
jgi:hypothetical protein